MEYRIRKEMKIKTKKIGLENVNHINNKQRDAIL